ncbi:adhesin [Luteimonas sp. A277]
MKGNLKMTALAVAVATFAMGTAAAQVAPPEVITTVDTDIAIFGDIEAVGEVAVGGELLVGGDVTLDYDYDYNDNLNRNVVVNDTTNSTVNETVTSDVSEFFTSDVSEFVSSDISETVISNVETNEVTSNIVRNEFGRTDIRGERDEHGVSVNIDKSISLNSDISFTGEPTITGEIDLDSAAIALVDNRQSNTENVGLNDMLTNDASIGDDVGTAASGNLQFNVAAGDNNVQDNAAALAAADAGFSFGLADAEIFVNQYGAGNATVNMGVTNSASLGNNAFSDASGNIGANIASGNNNMQKNAMASSVATAAYAQASVSSNQISTGNVVSNTGVMEELTDTIDITLSGTVSGETSGSVTGTYEGSALGGYAGTGNSYQSSNFYADMWEGEEHPAGDAIGHADFDSESQGAVANPFRDGVGGLGFDNVEEGEYAGTESGTLSFDELSFSDLQASLAGTVTTTQWIVRDATNTATLSDNAFANASGNIGVNLAAGSGNMQANSLSMAVAQPGANGGNGGNGGPE